MPDPILPDGERDRVLMFLERAAPWIVGGLIVLLVLLGLLGTILGAPWMR